jgi:putative dimethyl sulfoxide reductase chaperone
MDGASLVGAIMTAVLFRLWVYEYLAQLFDGTVTHLPEPPEADGSSARLATAAHAIRAAVAGSSTEDLLADHARLFVNARHGVVAPPYASWYLDRRLLGPSSRRVEQAYAGQGLETAPDAGEPPDYLGTELEFLLFLARHELAARSTGDEHALCVVLDTEATFVLSHVARWLPAFISQIRTAEPGGVFAAAADLLSAVMHDDVRRLSGGCSNPTASLSDE